MFCLHVTFVIFLWITKRLLLPCGATRAARDGAGAALPGGRLRALLRLAHPHHAAARPAGAAARRSAPAATDGAAALVCHHLPGPHDAPPPGVVQGVHILRSRPTAAVLSRRSVCLLKRWLQMDKDSCNYILHPCSYNIVCYPGSHPVPWFLSVRASGSSDTAWAPHSVICICTILADTTSDSFYHAVQPPVQPGGEKEKEVVCSKRCKHNFSISFDPDPSPLTNTKQWCQLQYLLPKRHIPARKVWIGFCSQLFHQK